VVFAVAAIRSGASALAPVGALLGFLIWNWSRRGCFMGDVGSTLPGAVFAGVVLQAPGVCRGLRCLLVAVAVAGDALLLLAAADWPASRCSGPSGCTVTALQQAGWSHRRVCLLVSWGGNRA